MSLSLCTASTKMYRPLAEMTDPGKLDYCVRWGLIFAPYEHREPVTCWDRPRIWQEELRRNEWMFWTGTDVLITNHRIDVCDLLSDDADFIFCADGNGLQSDSFLMRNTTATEVMLSHVRAAEHQGVGNEQDALNIYLSKSRNYSEYCSKVGDLRQGGEPPPPELLKKLEVELSRSPVRVKILPQRRLNAYPHKEYGTSNDVAHSWNPGDFIMHMPGISLEYRLAVFPDYLKEVIR